MSFLGQGAPKNQALQPNIKLLLQRALKVEYTEYPSHACGAKTTKSFVEWKADIRAESYAGSELEPIDCTTWFAEATSQRRAQSLPGDGVRFAPDKDRYRLDTKQVETSCDMLPLPDRYTYHGRSGSQRLPTTESTRLAETVLTPRRDISAEYTRSTAPTDDIDFTPFHSRQQMQMMAATSQHARAHKSADEVSTIGRFSMRSWQQRQQELHQLEQQKQRLQETLCQWKECSSRLQECSSRLQTQVRGFEDSVHNLIRREEQAVAQWESTTQRFLDRHTQPKH